MPEKKIVRFKVFLIDFPDVRAPSGYSKEFVNTLLFAASSDGKSPAPDRAEYGPTAYQFFFAHSDGWLRLAGQVRNWVRSDIDNGDIPHWNGKMTKPTDGGPKVDYGESWPVIVAETLRGAGLVSKRGQTGKKLRDKILALPGGKKADRLIFLHADRASGGVRRSFAKMKSQLKVMSHDQVRKNRVPGRTARWETLWDNGWSGLPDFLATPILTASQTTNRADGTFTSSAPGSNALKMSPLSIIFHELGHLATDFPDLYTPRFEPWGVFDLMGGPAAWTHFPMPFASYLSERAGWLDFRDRSREDHRLRLRPYETHNEAWRLTNGAPGSNHFLVLENRDELHYSGWDSVPSSQGRMLLAYRLDEHGRLRVGYGEDVHRKVTSIVRRKKSYGEAWKAGESIGAIPDSIDKLPGTCRNARGELWWTLDEITEPGFGDLHADLRMQGLHLLTDFHRADWRGEAPRVRPVSLEPDKFAGRDGHVILQEHTLKVKGRSRGKALYLHPRWRNHGRVRGIYELGAHGGAPVRLYAKVAMSDEAVGSDGARLVFRSGRQSFAVDLKRGEYREICVDFSAPGSTFEVIAEAKGTATRDWIYLLDGWVVPTAPTHYNFLERASSARWTTGSGRLTFNQQDKPTGEASLRSRMVLHTGTEHGRHVLFTHPNWKNDGFVQGVYRNVSVPSKGAFIRGAIGWHQGRKANLGGAKVTVSVKAGGSTTTLLDGALLEVYGRSSDPMKRNDLMLLELPLPGHAKGKKAEVTFRVDTDGSAAQDWVAWPYLALTGA